jgi:hypothetical protein
MSNPCPTSPLQLQRHCERFPASGCCAGGLLIQPAGLPTLIPPPEPLNLGQVRTEREDAALPAPQELFQERPALFKRGLSAAAPQLTGDEVAGLQELYAAQFPPEPLTSAGDLQRAAEFYGGQGLPLLHLCALNNAMQQAQGELLNRIIDFGEALMRYNFADAATIALEHARAQADDPLSLQPGPRARLATILGQAGQP